MTTAITFQTWFKSLLPSIPLTSAEKVLSLTAEGGTIPFIARYRKEATGGLDEVQIQKVIDAKENWDTLTQRQTFILGEIEKQGKLTDELKAKIQSTFQSNLLEDIYLPYKIKKKSKATLAKEAGLQPLADWIWDCGHGTLKPEPGQTLEIWAFTFRNDEKGFTDAEKCIQGAQDILVERLSENGVLRQKVRDAIFEKGGLKTGKADKAKPNSKYETYFSYFEPIQTLRKPENSHRYLAIRRGWMEEELTLSIGGNHEDTSFEDELLQAFENEAVNDRHSVGAEILIKAAKLAFKAHVYPAIENEAHKAIKEVADETAIRVFAENVKKLLLASPFGPKAVMGVDPGIRTGCKVAVISDSGRFIADTVIHLQSDDQKTKAKELLTGVIQTGQIRAIAVGNGTAGRETEAYLRAMLKEASMDVPVVMVSESGASVYSASEAAREEFPDLDLTVRGAISIARRLQDPLAELVKVEPKAIGVGQYQHDVAPHALKKSLELVVDTCVNSVGVNLNTASYHLLSRVSGIGPALAKAIVEYRAKHGIFKSRKDLLEVPRFSTKTFEQAAGFLRIPEAENPLDNTGVHPERYGVLEGLAKNLGKSISDLMGREGVSLIKESNEHTTTLKTELGEFTFNDILNELEKPGRDPREAFIPFSFRDDIFEMKDLTVGMVCPGIVTNVTNFGAFVDIGVHQDGLVHISQLSNSFIKDPREVVSPGDRVTVRVLEANLDKKQIALSMKTEKSAETSPSPDHNRENKRGQRENKRQPKNNRRPEKPAPVFAKPSGAPPAIQAKSAQPALKGKPLPKGPQKPQFTNNPFAALAGLKKDLKN
jgi:uncharacterized protein